MVVEYDLSKLKLAQTVMVLKFKLHCPGRSVDLEEVERMPSLQTEVQLDVRNLLPAVGQWVVHGDAHFRRISARMVTSRLEADTRKV